MSGEVTATLVVNFDGGSNGGHLSAEVDARPDGYNTGRTSFVSGDEPAFLVFMSSDVTVDSIEPSAGSIEALGTGVMEVSEDLSFADVAEADLSKPFYNGMSAKWLGNNLGVPTISENKVTIPAAGVGVLRVTYNALFTAHRIADVPYPLNGERTFPVLVVISGTRA